MKKETIIIVAIYVISAIVFMWLFMTFGIEDIEVSGYITDKFRTGQFGGLYYYFTIDGCNDIMISESVWYSYEIGDYYER
jgi:hypothetical protein